MMCRIVRNTVISACLLLLFLLSAELSAQHVPGRWSAQLSGGIRQPTLNQKHQPWAVSPSFDGRLCYRLTKSVSVGGLLSYSKIYNDSVSTSTFKIGREQANEYWKSVNLGLVIVVHIDNSSQTYPGLKFGIGISSWEANRVENDKPVIVSRPDGSETDYKASELFLMTGIGGETPIHPRWGITYDIDLYVMPGFGADFDSRTNDYRSHGYANLRVGLAFHFGKCEKTLWERWREDEKEESQQNEPSPSAEYDADRDSTEDGTQIEDYLDSDNDGVKDGVDLCPNTPAEAAGFVDEAGCLIDTDADDVADYLDSCLNTPIGMSVDSVGCSIDEDSDGVTDSLDECPGTPLRYPVDKIGCIDRASLFKKKVLHVKYQPGGSDVDTRTSIYLDTLVQMLNHFDDVKIKIIGYTDNIGNENANLKLSKKRADKVFIYLAASGVDQHRMVAIGKGETDFIATNANKYGRELNRRIEIEFEY
ncbi:MAG: OmpA family protein [candidate division Zixibacteria bacterium]|nr:OmpA family protein [candidate division Zixibacteria bacterium]